MYIYTMVHYNTPFKSFGVSKIFLSQVINKWHDIWRPIW